MFLFTFANVFDFYQLQNFVGLSIYDGYIATGSETNEVCLSKWIFFFFLMPALLKALFLSATYMANVLLKNLEYNIVERKKQENVVKKIRGELNSYFFLIFDSIIHHIYTILKHKIGNQITNNYKSWR